MHRLWYKLESGAFVPQAVSNRKTLAKSHRYFFMILIPSIFSHRISYHKPLSLVNILLRCIFKISIAFWGRKQDFFGFPI
jgi:hypothetical protein